MNFPKRLLYPHEFYQLSPASPKDSNQCLHWMLAATIFKSSHHEDTGSDKHHFGTCEIFHIPFKSGVYFFMCKICQSSKPYVLEAHLPNARLLGWEAQCGSWTPHSFERTFAIVIILSFVGCLLRCVMTFLCLYLSYLSQFSFFFSVVSCGKYFLLVFSCSQRQFLCKQF